MDSFWKAALGVAGLAAVGLAVFYKLYDHIISLGILIGLSQTESFVTVIVLALLIFGIASFAIWVWYLNNKNARAATSLAIEQKITGLEFEIPPNWTFQGAATALAQAEKTTVTFIGFSAAQLNTRLRPQKLSTVSTEIAFERLGDIAIDRIPSYKATNDKGSYRLTVF